MIKSQSEELVHLLTLLESLRISNQIKYRIESLNVVIDQRLSGFAFEVEIKSINDQESSSYQGDTMVEALTGAYKLYLRKQSVSFDATRTTVIKSLMSEAKSKLAKGVVNA